ncbi:hypothetical protein [Conexibacter sp. SYSU D00693]|uniref:hypothetical protein n=1 Tax=Conexibacter sp. SYSU D00693 TaxID=2812560 RepID=UPI001F11C230|nr:hypothetical protein [Conexibacter sp. SYSU D00693]
MELHEEAEAVVREVVLPADRDAAWEHVRDLAWLGEEAEVVEEQAPHRLALRWSPDRGTVVDVVLDDHEDGTRVVVVETPVRVLRAVSTAVVAGTSSGTRGPLALA